MNCLIFGLIAFTLFFGCIQIQQIYDGQGTNKPPKVQGEKPDNDLSDSDSESNQPGATISKKPLNIKPGQDTTIVKMPQDTIIAIHKNKSVNVDLYGFLNNKPDFSSLPEPTTEAQCEEDCDDYCDQDAETCESACAISYNQVCGNAAVATSVCESSCMAIPFPWVITDCISACEDEFEEACDPDDLHDCQNHCQHAHKDACIDMCYDQC